MPVDLVTLQKTVEQAVASADSLNKVWIATAAVCATLLSALIATSSQLYIAARQRRTQESAAADQLSIQELNSRRTAIANISAKRQVWIDELRTDMAEFLATWQDITYRWEALVYRQNADTPSKEEKNNWIETIEDKRLDVHKLRIRIQLRLNAKESKHLALRDLMISLENETELLKRNLDPLPIGFIGINVPNIVDQMIPLVQAILKEEWDRIKRESFVDPIVAITP